jgi:hypothetical protein
LIQTIAGLICCKQRCWTALQTCFAALQIDLKRCNVAMRFSRRKPIGMSNSDATLVKKEQVRVAAGVSQDFPGAALHAVLTQAGRTKAFGQKWASPLKIICGCAGLTP